MRAYTEAERLTLMTRDRRALHQIPEFGYDLFETRAYVRAELEKTAPDRLEPCDEGLKAVYLAASPRRGAIAFRADMDALRIQEETTHDFPSRHPGYMHACGHDGHMSALLMLARIVGASRAELDRHVVLIFQPAEENQGGARRMLNAGAFADPEVTEVYGMHLMPQVPRGKIGVRPGPLMALVEAVDITVTGQTAHGAQPQNGCDAVVAAAQIITSIQAALSRVIDPMETRLFTVGSLQAGTIANIIADRAELHGTLRAFNDETAERIHEIIRGAMAGADALYGTHSEMTILMKYPAVINHAAPVEKLRRLAGERAIDVEPLAIAEDFSEYLRDAPGAFFFCGYGDDEHQMALHSSSFDFDERALLTGVEMFEKLIFEA